MAKSSITLNPIGRVHSTLTSRKNAPRQGYRDGAPDAWIELDASVSESLLGIEPGVDVIVLTWLHEADRNTLRVRPGRNPDGAIRGVFSTRSPDRPNPIGLHRVTVREIAGNRLRVGPIEAIDGTPVLDIKPVLRLSDDR